MTRFLRRGVIVTCEKTDVDGAGDGRADRGPDQHARNGRRQTQGLIAATASTTDVQERTPDEEPGTRKDSADHKTSNCTAAFTVRHVDDWTRQRIRGEAEEAQFEVVCRRPGDHQTHGRDVADNHGDPVRTPVVTSRLRVATSRKA